MLSPTLFLPFINPYTLTVMYTDIKKLLERATPFRVALFQTPICCEPAAWRPSDTNSLNPQGQTNRLHQLRAQKRP